MKQLQICHLRIAAGPAAAQPTPKVAVAKPASAAVELEQAAAGQTAAAEQQALEQAKLIGATGEEQQQPGGSDQQAADQGSSGAEQSSAGGAGQLTEEQLAASLDPTAEQLQQEAAATASPADEQSAPDELGAQPEEQPAAGAAAAAAVSSVCWGACVGWECMCVPSSTAHAELHLPGLLLAAAAALPCHARICVMQGSDPEGVVVLVVYKQPGAARMHARPVRCCWPCSTACVGSWVAVFFHSPCLRNCVCATRAWCAAAGCISASALRYVSHLRPPTYTLLCTHTPPPAGAGLTEDQAIAKATANSASLREFVRRLTGGLGAPAMPLQSIS